jgi:hypothetical protein
MQLALQFLGQADERTSVFHSNLLVEKKSGDGITPRGMRIPARVDDGPAVAGPNWAREIAPELQGCLRDTVGRRLV